MAQQMAIDVHDRTLFVEAVDADTGEELCRRRFPHTPAGIAEIRGRRQASREPHGAIPGAQADLLLAPSTFHLPPSILPRWPGTCW